MDVASAVASSSEASVFFTETFGAAFSDFDVALDLFSPWWMELCFIISFPLGYYFLTLDLTKKSKSSKKARSPRNSCTEGSSNGDNSLMAAVEDVVASSDTSNVLPLWRKAQSSAPSSADVLRAVVQQLASASPETCVQEVKSHLERHASVLCNPKSALAILDAVGHGKHSDLLDELSNMCNVDLGIPMTYQWYETLLGGHAFSGNADRVDEICEDIEKIGQKLTARGFALVIKGFLCRGMLDTASKHIQAMRQQGFYIPPFAVTLLFKTASEHNRVQEIFEVCCSESVALPEEAVAIIFEDCLKRSNIVLAKQIEDSVRQSNGGVMPPAAVEPLLKLLIVLGDSRALDIWKEMIKSGSHSEGLLIGLLVRCAEAKFLSLAEEVLEYARKTDKVSIAVYSAMMKVYSYCGFYDRACDLYPEILARGLTPDNIVYSCLMRFAAECGRTELAKQLAEQSPQLDTQNYMCLIRSAGRDKDVERAFSLLKQYTAAEPNPDVAVYNCVLDACVCSGALDRAKEFALEMRQSFGKLDIITYNTVVKGITAAGDSKGAQQFLKEMNSDGVKPNDITYNCIINAAATNGEFRQVWDMIAKMEKEDIKVDHYTLSILLKALKRPQNARETSRVLALLDSSNVDVCSEEVLFNTLLEVCTQLGERKRLQDLLNLYQRSSMKPSMHLYGALIKAASFLKRLDFCRSLWRELTKDRLLEPNDIVLGCMMDALVCNKQVSEAVDLYRQWKSKVGPNMVMLSTVVKGFASDGRAEEAMELWRDARSQGATLNAVVYNALIDAQARSGRTEDVATLFAAMKEEGIPADAITYSTMVKSHCVKGDLTEALSILSEMQSMGLCKDCIVFNTLLDWCTRQNRMDVADKVLATFLSLNIPPTNFTVGILVKMYGRRRMLDQAFAVATDMPKQWNFKPNAQVYTCLMSACFLNNSVNRAFEVFEQLKGQGADGKSYGVLIGGCVKAGKIREAVAYVEEAYGLNNKQRSLPSWSDLGPEVLEPLLRSLNSRGLADEVGLPLVASLRRAGVSVNARLLNTAFEESSSRPNNRKGPDSNSHNSRSEKDDSGNRNWGSLRNSGNAAYRAPRSGRQQ